MPQDQEKQHLRIVRNYSGERRTLALLDLSRPGAVQVLSDVSADWLYERCSDEGKRKLLREHQLLAA